jgi:hypothetical protein
VGNSKEKRREEKRREEKRREQRGRAENVDRKCIPGGSPMPISKAGRRKWANRLCLVLQKFSKFSHYKPCHLSQNSFPNAKILLFELKISPTKRDLNEHRRQAERAGDLLKWLLLRPWLYNLVPKSPRQLLVSSSVLQHPHLHR